MPEEEKNKYDELEELPVEAVPEPLAESAQPAQNAEQPPPQEREAAGGTSSDIGKKIEAAAKVRDASEVLRGQKRVKVIKKSAIKAIVDGIVQSYAGLQHKELLSKIAEFEFDISNLKQENQRLKEEMERLVNERQTFQDELALKYEKEIEELKTRLASAQKLLAEEVSLEKLKKLEEEVLYLRQRVKELEHALEFAAVVEEYDYGMAIESALTQKEKIAGITARLDSALEASPEAQGPREFKELLTGLSERYDFLMELLKESQYSYNNLFKKMAESEGSVGVIAELIRLNARNRGWGRELELSGQFVDAAETALKAIK